jgi:hypothetical protein
MEARTMNRRTLRGNVLISIITITPLGNLRSYSRWKVLLLGFVTGALVAGVALAAVLALYLRDQSSNDS